jgi:hypothetical protein
MAQVHSPLPKSVAEHLGPDPTTLMALLRLLHQQFLDRLRQLFVPKEDAEEDHATEELCRMSAAEGKELVVVLCSWTPLP